MERREVDMTGSGTSTAVTSVMPCRKRAYPLVRRSAWDSATPPTTLGAVQRPVPANSASFAGMRQTDASVKGAYTSAAVPKARFVTCSQVGIDI